MYRSGEDIMKFHAHNTSDNAAKKEIAKLRAKAHIARAKHNLLIDAYWDLDKAIANTENSEDKKSLTAKRTELLKEIQESPYEKAYDKLIKDIIRLEEKIGIHSGLSISKPSLL